MARPTAFTSEIPGFDVDSKLLDVITGVASLDLEVSHWGERASDVVTFGAFGKVMNYWTHHTY